MSDKPAGRGPGGSHDVRASGRGGRGGRGFPHAGTGAGGPAGGPAGGRGRGGRGGGRDGPAAGRGCALIHPHLPYLPSMPRDCRDPPSQGAALRPTSHFIGNSVLSNNTVQDSSVGNPRMNNTLAPSLSLVMPACADAAARLREPLPAAPPDNPTTRR